MLKRPPHNMLTIALLGALLTLALTLGSCSNLKPKGHRVPSSGPVAAAGELTLPSPARPTPLPAARVLNILFTSNGDGDVDPCG